LITGFAKNDRTFFECIIALNLAKKIIRAISHWAQKFGRTSTQSPSYIPISTGTFLTKKLVKYSPQTMPGTVQFNVGGTLYTVSRSLLDSQHPNTMLARSASQQWQEDSEAEIFIERDGSIFRFVLNYMRDGRVVLPISESKESVLAELEYYGIEVDKCQVNDASMRKATCIKSFRDAVRDLEVLCDNHEVGIADAELDYRCSKYALDVLTTYMSQGDFRAPEIGFNFVDKDQKDNVSQLLKMNKHADIKEKVNYRLRFVGLQLAAFDAVYGGDYMDARAKLIDPSETFCKNMC